MKKFTFVSLLIVLSVSAWAREPGDTSPNLDERNCGGRYSHYISTPSSDSARKVDDASGAMVGITLTGVQRKTNVIRAFAVEADGTRREVTSVFLAKAKCENVAGRLCPGDSVTACIPASGSFTVTTEGSNSGRYEIRAVSSQ
ncbi:MAG: hypothetical protein AB7H97_00655 [Pseudobdellovibrionaceae bacterium]